ncbi:MAG: hypothetical protein LBC33_00525 [Mycoplasmataceae bacterium]|nr:hypothetical protein [Mycoplasmataceae bacterium]
MLVEDSEKQVKLQKMLPTQYAVTLLSGIIGFVFLIPGLIMWTQGGDHEWLDWIEDYLNVTPQLAKGIFLAIGIVFTCVFLIYLSGTWNILASIHKLSKKIQSETLASEL